jgi:hypothetical protein
MFIRENLSKNIYLLNRMNNNLEIPLEIIYNERKIKSLSQDSNQILKVIIIFKIFFSHKNYIISFFIVNFF